MDFNSHSSDPERARSYRNLENARENASRTTGYNSEQTRNALKDSFRERFGYDPHFWQLDVTEAMLLGLDCIVIAGTGAGKTAPFMMLVLPDPKKKTLILSPLKVLQEDQVSRFWAAKLPAAAVNGDTWDGLLKQDLEADIYQGIFASPEMCLKHPEFRRVLSDSNFENMVGWIVDEAHCIRQWGGDFRPTYGELGKLRAFFPPDVPVLATSATMTPLTLRDVRTTLGIDPQTSFFLNLGNDRPNISFHVHKIKSATDYDSLRPHLFNSSTPSVTNDLIKGIVFVNAIMPVHIIARTVRSWLPRRLQDIGQL